jgi:RHS repeat-associated protein
MSVVRFLGLVLLLALASCASEDAGKTSPGSGVRRDGLADVLKDSIGMVPLSSHFVMIPRSAWDYALTHQPNGEPRPGGLGGLQSTTALRKEAALAAAVANDATALGVVSNAAGASGSFSAADILVVVDSATTDPDSGRVMATSYFISAVGLNGNSPWLARGMDIGVQPLSSGGGRCCGPAAIGEQKTPLFGPGSTPPDCSPGPIAYCSWGQVRPGGSIGHDATRLSVGRPVIPLVMFSSSGVQMEFSMAGPLGGVGVGLFDCNYSTPLCMETPSGVPWGGWEGELPHGNPGCASPGSYSGVSVPPQCTFASGATFSATSTGIGVIRPAGGGLSPAECDGQCPECSQMANVTNTGIVPRQCWLQTLPGDICEKNTSAQIEAYQNDVQGMFDFNEMSSCGDPQDPSARCKCSNAASGATPVWECVRCTETAAGRSCGVYVGDQHGVPVSPARGPDVSPGGESPRSTAEGSGVSAGLSPFVMPQPPCTAGCDQHVQIAHLVSRAPRPGGSAETADGPLDDLNAANLPEGETPNTSVDGSNDKNSKVKPKTDGDPVSLFDGALVLGTSDLSFPGPVRPLTFTRNYNSRASTRGPLGSNWSHNFEARIIPLKKQNLPAWVDPYCMGTPLVTTCVMLVSGESSRIFYLDQATGIFMPQAGTMATIREVASSDPAQIGWALRQPDGSILRFDRYGYLTRDTDRFGNGFRLDYESTAAGIVYEAVCPGVPYWMTAQGQYVPGVGKTGVSSEMQGCVLLAGLTGFTNMPAYSNSIVVTDTMFGSPLSNPTVTSARAAVVASQPKFGTPLPYGQAHRRLTKVTDDLGRQFHFEYFSSGSNAGLLQRVTGPSGTGIEFSYSSDSNAPAGLNERFLTRAKRIDGATGSSLLTAAGDRGYDYEYAWQRSGYMPTDLGTAASAYTNYFANIYNCGSLAKAPCSDKWVSTVQFADVPALVAEQTRRLYSEAADNVLTVTVFGGSSSKIESETRYGQNVYHVNFDRALEQRWGTKPPSVLPATGLTVSAFSWDSSMPLATFSYQGAEPIGTNGTLSDDQTTAFLPAALRARYALEADVFAGGPGGPIQSAYDKGFLLPRASTTTIPWDARPHVARGETQVLENSTRAACGIEKLPQFRTSLPGYSPSIDYYDLTSLPTTELATPGVSYEQQLKRTWLSCETLALAETYDVRHNDLASTWSNALDGGYVVESMTGRRKHTAANANRICEWTRYTDRDGDEHVTGLNFQGRPLVEAVKVIGAEGEQWKVAETLYNADGNVLSQRRTSSAAWTPSTGDTRYTYQEEPIAPNSVGTTRPLHWEKRGNVVRVWQRPRGGIVNDEEEGSGAVVASKGRYTVYAYEPFFNQVRLVVRGNVRTNGTDEPLERTILVSDYQELGPTSAELQALLQEAKWWGAPFPTTTENQTIDWNAVKGRLGIEVFGLDVDGDGETGGRLGVPILVRSEAGAAFYQHEDTLIRWNSSGRPYVIEAPDGSRTVLQYYPRASSQTGLADLAPSGTANGGNAGLLASVARSRNWPASAGPARVGCDLLPSQYRFLLSSCSDPATELEALGLAPEAIEGVKTAPSESTTTFNYNPLGYLSAVRDATGVRTVTKTDTDGRVLRSELYPANAASLQLATLNHYDDYKRAERTERLDVNGDSLGMSFRTFDDSDQVLTECVEAKPEGCVTGGGDSVKRSWVYTREGHLFREVDGAGLTTQYERDARKWVTRQKLISPDPNDPVRQTLTAFDDDGNVMSRTFGQAMPLTESMSWDGLGRLRKQTDTQLRETKFGYSKLDVQVSRELVGDDAGPVRMYHDGFGRTSIVEQNGLTLAAYDRMPGGLVYGQSATGRGQRFVTYDALGQVAWAENSVGDQFVATEVVKNAHVVTQSRVRQQGLKTTSVIAELDALGLPKWSKEAGGQLSRTTTYTRDAVGNLVAVVAPNTARTEADYDFLGRMVAQREQMRWGASAFETSSFTYNVRGQLETLTDPVLNVTVQLYDGFGAPSHRTIPASSPQVSQWSYDDLGRKTSHTVGSQVVLGYKYDALGRLDQVVKGSPADPNAELLLDYDWDSLGRLAMSTRSNLGTSSVLASSARTVSTKRTYDNAKRWYTESTKVGGQSERLVTIKWFLDGNQNWVREVTLPSGRVQAHAFDSEGREVEQVRATGQSTSFAWVDELLVSTTSTAGDVLTRSTQFDDLAQSVDWDHTVGGASVLHVAAVRDVSGRIATSEATFKTAWGPVQSWRGYVYDVLGRLAAVHESNTSPLVVLAPNGLTETVGQDVDTAGASVSASRFAYTREIVGSIRKIDDGVSLPRFESPKQFIAPSGLQTSRGPGHELVNFRIGSVSRKAIHDDSGRLESDGDQTYVFDDLEALALVREQATGSLREGYLYDASGRLSGRVDGQANLAEVLIHDGVQMVESYRGDEALKWTASWAPGIDNLLSITRENSEEFFALDDGKANVVGWVGAQSMSLLAYAEFTPEGRAKFTDALTGSSCEETDATRCARPLDIPFGFHSGYSSSTTGLIYFRNRWYSPEAAEWLSQDPLQFVDSFNLYAFNAFDSVNFSDPLGLEAKALSGKNETTVRCVEGAWSCGAMNAWREAWANLNMERRFDGPSVAVAKQAVEKGFVGVLGITAGVAAGVVPFQSPPNWNGPRRREFHIGAAAGSVIAAIAGFVETISGGLTLSGVLPEGASGVLAPTIPVTINAAVTMVTHGVLTVSNSVQNASNSVAAAMSSPSDVVPQPHKPDAPQGDGPKPNEPDPQQVRDNEGGAPPLQPGQGPSIVGPKSPAPRGMPPYAKYTKTSADGTKAIQNTIYNGKGDAVGQVDFKQHGTAPPGHWHEFPPGDPKSGHGPDAPHNSPDTAPVWWSDVPEGMVPAQ